MAVGLLSWWGVLWDGFATIILPRTVAPMRRISGRFYRWSWRLWSAVGRRIRSPGYCGTGHSDVLRDNLREAERWMAEILQSHLCHPVLSFYRAQHWGQSWLVSVTTVLDNCALLIAGGDGLLTAQARITYRMGFRLLVDLTNALCLKADPRCRTRLTEADLTVPLAVLKSTRLDSSPESAASLRLLRLVRRYDVYLFALSKALVIPLPPWIPTTEEGRETDVSEDSALLEPTRSTQGSELEGCRNDLPLSYTCFKDESSDRPKGDPQQRYSHDPRPD